jgi:hypothetical protein
MRRQFGRQQKQDFQVRCNTSQRSQQRRIPVCQDRCLKRSHRAPFQLGAAIADIKTQRTTGLRDSRKDRGTEAMKEEEAPGKTFAARKGINMHDTLIALAYLGLIITPVVFAARANTDAQSKSK